MNEQYLRFRNICAGNGYPLTEDHERLLQGYVADLLEWNRKINLVSRKDTDNIWFAHVLHSTSILFLESIPDGARVLDLGSGGGLPGIPMAILRKDLSVTLLDSIKKKTMVLEEMKKHLGLANVSVRTGRAEEMKKELAGKFNVMVARGVAPLIDLIDWGMPLVSSHRLIAAPAGKPALRVPAILALKGGDLDNEIEVVRIKRKGIVIEVKPIVFSGSEEIGLEEKKLVIIQKVA